MISLSIHLIKILCILALLSILLKYPTGDHALQGDSDLEQPVAKKTKLDGDTTAPRAHSTTLSSNKDDSTTLTGLPNPPLFYLTRVRGIRDCYNGPGMAIGIRGQTKHMKLVSRSLYNAHWYHQAS